jgi:hypothetical protein
MIKPNGLPDWFNLENYNDTELLSPYEWYINLKQRSRFFMYQRFIKYGPFWRPLEEFESKLNKVVNEIVTKPLLKSSDEVKIFTNEPLVRSLTNGDFIRNFESLQDSAPLIYLEFMQLKKQHEKSVYLKLYSHEEFNKESKPHNFAYLSVDLHAAEEQIIEDFKKCLKNIRKNMQHPTVKKIFSSKDFNQWHEYKILPYLDLTIWGTFSGQKFTQALIGNALFHDEVELDTTERIRRTTKPKADWLMRPSILDALKKQILIKRG